MLTADIHFSDLHAPVDIIDGRILFGASHITPFPHRLLRAVVVDTDDAVTVACLERFRDDPDGLDLVRPEQARDAADRLDTIRSHLLDWSILTIDRVSGLISYEASLVHSAPVFFRTAASHVAIDWDSSRLLRDTSVSIHWPVMMAQIAGMLAYTPQTPIAGLYRSLAGATLTIHGATVDARLPEAMAMPGAQDLLQDQSAEDLLYETVLLLMAARDFDSERTAVELSGGMDSALIALAAADISGPGLLSYGAQFRGAMGDAQRSRRDLLCRRGQFEDIVVPANRFPPFGPGSARRTPFGVWPQDENYPELFEAIFDMLARAGIDTLASGFGGDELYAVYTGEEAPDDGSSAATCFAYLTERGRHLALQGGAPRPQIVLAETSLLATAARSQRLLRRGIWPIYPYINPILARFVASLPWEYRRDRTVLRRALTDRLGDPVFQRDYAKESFREVAIRGLVENRDYLQSVLSRSAVLDPDLIHRDRISATLASDIESLSDADFGFVFRVLAICCFFDAGDQEL